MTSGVVIVGVGQLRNNRGRTLDEAREPLELICEAVALAAADSGAADRLLAATDLISVVEVISWAYSDLPKLIGDRVGATSPATSVTGSGGHQPVAALSEAARRIADGEVQIAIVCGGEAQSSVNTFRQAGVEPTWSRDPGGPVSFSRDVGGTERMWELGLVLPTRVYPMFENRLRHDLGQSFDEAQQWSAEMYADFSRVAGEVPASWNPDPLTPDGIRTVTARNRMICFPYPLLMNANSAVDQAAAVILTSVDVARELGIDERKHVHVVAAGGAADTHDILERATFGDAPGMRVTLDHVMDASAITVDDIDVLDLYSCFPIVPKLASLHLGKPDVALTATGGLTSFGGPHNNYSSHAVVNAVDRLRAGGGVGLVYANGEYLTMHEAVTLSSRPPEKPFTSEPSLVPDPPSAPFRDGYIGPAVIETYTVEYSREGEPSKGIVVGTNPDGVRVAARVGKNAHRTMRALVDGTAEPIGRIGSIDETDGRRSFALDGDQA